MLFKNNLCLQWETYKSHKYKMQSHWLLKQVAHTLATVALER
jgi:hypothetical protein